MSDSHRELRLRLALSTQQIKAYYQGQALSIQATTLDGRNVRFPANILRPFLRQDGVQGLFVLRIDQRNRVVEMRRIAD